MTAREDAIEAIARALHADNCPDDVDWGEPCGCSDWDREAGIAYEAADPIIRADERKHLRAQVKALRMQIVIDGFTSEYEARLAMADRFLALLGGESE